MPSSGDAREQSVLGELPNDLRLIRNLILCTPNIQETSTDYDAYWRDKRSSGSLGIPGIFQIHRAKWILPRLSDGDSVAEYGCGDAATLLWLNSRKKLRVIGLDVSEYALNFAAERGVDTFKILPGPNALDELPEADVYLLLEVLEHLPDPEAVLKRILSLTRKKVIISIPNTGYFPYRIRLLMGRFPVQWRIHPGEHLRFWTLQDFKWWLSQLGLAERSTIHAYKGVPLLNAVLPNAFGMGILCEIQK